MLLLPNQFKLIPVLFVFLILQLFTACSIDFFESILVNENNTSIVDGDSIIIEPYAFHSTPHQSAAIFGDYCILITDKRSSFHLYNLATKQMLCNIDLPIGSGTDIMGNVLYHCNQASFGTEFFSSQDPFPLLYLSQRAREDYRCFVEVFRVIPTKKRNDEDYTSMDAYLVQTIFLPQMSKTNCLGNVNCVIDSKSHLIYTYSRNNNTTDENYGHCKISSFEIPDLSHEKVFLEDSNIVDSFMVDCSAVYMQGGCINNGILYIGQGYQSAGYIYLNMIDINRRTLDSRIDLLGNGFNREPEGCFYYNGNVFIATDSCFWVIKLPHNK